MVMEVATFDADDSDDGWMEAAFAADSYFCTRRLPATHRGRTLLVVVDVAVPIITNG